MTLKIASQYVEFLKENSIPAQLLDLNILPKDFVFSSLYNEVNPAFDAILDQYILNVKGLIIVSPESKR